MGLQNKIVNLEEVVNEKNEQELKLKKTAELLKKEIDENSKFRLNNLIRHTVRKEEDLLDMKKNIAEHDRRFIRFEELMGTLIDHILEK